MGESMRAQLERIQQQADRQTEAGDFVGPREVIRRATIPRFSNLEEAQRYRAEHAAKVAHIQGQLQARTRFEFATDRDFYDWQRQAKAELARAQVQLALIRPILHELSQVKFDKEMADLARLADPQNQLDQIKALEAKIEALRNELRAAQEAAVTTTHRHAVEFVEVARVVLGETTFNRINARARDRVTTSK